MTAMVSSWRAVMGNFRRQALFAAVAGMLVLTGSAPAPVAFSTAATGSATFIPTQDVFVSSACPTCAGDHDYLRADPQRIAYVKFNVQDVPTGDEVTSVTLRLTGLDFGFSWTSGTVDIHKVGNGWDETTTYNTRPALGTRLTSGVLTDGQTTAFTIPVNNNTVDGNGVISFAVVKTTSGTVAVGASERGTLGGRPGLVVSWNAPTPPPPPPAVCGDGLDNDGDTKVDYPADPGCSSSTDTDETDAPPPPPPPAVCGDGLDNDGDTRVDYPADPGCTSSTDTDETDPTPPPPPPAVCGDGLDNDGDTKVDYPADPGCTSSTDTDETDPTPPPPPPAGDIWDEHVGFGNPTLTSAETRTVTSNADSGAGSLRAAVAGSTPKRVVFASDLTINITNEIPVGSNTLIDGRGHDVAIVGNDTTGGFILSSVSKVTLADLTLRHFGDVALTSSNATEDAIMVDNADDVWITHLDISGAADKAIGVQAGSVGVTVDWTHFHDQEQNFQIGNQFEGEAVGATQTVTAHHNFFDGTGYRNPVLSYGKAHLFNNYYRDWANYGARSERIGQMLFEGNVALGVRDPNITEITAVGNGCNDSGSLCDDRDGYLKLVNNATLPGSIALVWKSNLPGNVFTPPYTYTADTANQALADTIAAGVGPA